MASRPLLAASPTRSNPGAAPLVEELLPAPEAAQVFRALAARPHVIYFDSARRDSVLGRYSFISADPVSFLRLTSDDPDALGQLSRWLGPMGQSPVAGLPPFQGGAAGLFSYELGRQFERIAAASSDPFGVPILAVGLYDVVVAFDHLTGRAWLISQGLPAASEQSRLDRARERLNQFRGWIVEPAPLPAVASTEMALPLDKVAPCFTVPGPAGLVSNFTREGYVSAVRRAIEYIYAGDIFQVNLSQRLLYPAHGSALDLYLRLRERNAAPFAGYFDLGDFQIVSASPERFLKVVGGDVETRPIKGTRHRPGMPEADLFTGDHLEASIKDRAENVMIVDLLRNDLSKVCRRESVRVTQLCRVETYQFVQHLVSEVRGVLRDGCTPLDLLRGAFPGGSITGAPKPRAMQIIAELEPSVRGAYCGSLGYLGFDGSCDTNLLIRTITAGRGWWQMGVGGGIVAKSMPKREYEETWHKAQGLLRALE